MNPMTLNEYQDTIDAASDRDMAEERIAEELWTGMRETPLHYVDLGCFAEIDFTADQRATMIQAVAKMREKDELSAWYAQSIVNTVVAAVSKIVYDEAMSEYLGSGE